MSDFIQEDNGQELSIGEETSSQSMEQDENSSSSSIDNIIPVEKIKNGFFAISTFVVAAGNKLLDKVVEINNSDEVQSFKTRASESSAKVWESTKDTAAKVGAAVEPTIEKVATYTSEGATTLYRSASSAYSSAKSELFPDSSSPATTTEEIPSALDQASKGGPHQGPISI